MAAADGGVGVRIDEEDADGSFHLQKFRLYETRSTFYMIGRDKTRTYWKVLKIDRVNPTELNIWEDPTTYSKNECQDLLKMIHEGNRSTGGLKFINNCYGIIGFIKFLGPYYMLIITKRRQIGSICGHNVYAVSKSEMIALSCSTTPLDTANSKSENRYKKLLCTVDLTKDFFFSYSYHVMHSLQKNLSDSQNGLATYETMFVWNGFLTRGIRNLLKNTLWTVALVHGFFKQDTLKISEKEFKLTLIARRSRYYAGTRYRKRGVNEKGRVANDVETEQIVSEDVPGACSTQLTAVVQHRGSIPLFWSQETSRLNIRPDIILQKKDQHYEATKLHFENLVKRYGNPIIIFNLIKKREKKPRESILHSEFANAIDFINKDLSDENRLKFVHWDLHKLSRRKATNVLLLLARVAAYALTLTDLFYCQLTPPLGLEGSLNWPFLEKEADTEWPSMNCKRGAEDSQNEVKEDDSKSSSYCFAKPCRLQSGVLRTNCIDCLDRTNVSQFAYGLAAFGHQLHALGLIAVPKIDLDAPLAEELMRLYEAMGDTLALQYGGSGAHNKIFSERRGQWKAATQSQEFFRTLQRYYSNAYMDAEKQDAINVFLGYFQPQQGKPALWELDSDQYYNIGRLSSFSEEISRSSFKRSLSEGNILSECKNAITGTDGGHELMNPELPEAMHQGGDAEGLPDMTTEISNVWGTSSSRYTPKMAQRQSFADSDHIYFNELGACGSNCSNFLDLDWLSSSANSCEDETFERVSPRSLPTETVSNDRTGETPALSENESIWRVRKATERELQSSSPEYSEVFMHWINHGEIFCH